MFENVSLPFSVQELISSAMDLFALVDQYVILALALVVGGYLSNLLSDVTDAYSEERSRAHMLKGRSRDGTQSKMQSLDHAWFKVSHRRGWRK